MAQMKKGGADFFSKIAIRLGFFPYTIEGVSQRFYP